MSGKPLKILTVSAFFGSQGGGIERVAGHLCRQFALVGVTPMWAASGREDVCEPAVETIPIHCVNPIEKLTGLPMPVPGPSGVAALTDAIRRCDVVVIHDALYATSILAMLLGKLYGKPTILIQHIAGIPFSSPVLRAVMWLANLVVTRPMLRVADARVFISETVRHDLLGTPSRLDCSVLFNGVDGAIFHPAEVGSEPAADGEPYVRRVLFVGRYVDKKGLAVVRALASARPDLSFQMAGDGPIRPAEWGLPNVRDLGRQTPADLANLYRAADLLLLPSVGEGYPLVIQEAMACGLPVICGEPSHRADPGAAGWLLGVKIDLADPIASADRVRAAIDARALSPSERAAMARYAISRYDWRVMAHGILALVRDTCPPDLQGARATHDP